MRDIKRILLLFTLCLLFINACSPTSPGSDFPVENKDGAGPTQIVVRILDLASISMTLTPADLPTFTLEATATQTATALPTPIPPTQVQSPPNTSVPLSSACTNQAKFIKNININDNTAFEGGESFTKIWRIGNVGTCTWSTSYSLVFSGGETMGGSLALQLIQEVKPGETIDLSLKLMAPLYAQSYTGNWMLQDEAGNIFGIGDLFDQPLSVTIVVKPPETPYQG